ncbi:MAG: hypothetical protein RL333_1688 [Pseudomonadota bacterium]
MLTTIARLLPVLAAFISGCSTFSPHPAVSTRRAEPVTPQALPETVSKPTVVTNPVDTGLEPVPLKTPLSFPIPEPDLALPEPNTNRPADATNSPYPPSGELPPAQSALPPIEPVIESPLPAIEVESTPDPVPMRTLAPRVGEKLFNQPALPAVATLEKDIESQFRARRYDDAATQIDRAIRIQPKNAELWHVLAEIRLRQNQPGLAVDLAKKSNSLAKSNAELVKSNWRIIADARRQQGDGAGAQDALEKAW